MKLNRRNRKWLTFAAIAAGSPFVIIEFLRILTCFAGAQWAPGGGLIATIWIWFGVCSFSAIFLSDP